MRLAGSTSFWRISPAISTSPAAIIRRTDSSGAPGKNSRASGCSRRAATAEAKASKSAPTCVAMSSMAGRL